MARVGLDVDGVLYAFTDRFRDYANEYCGDEHSPATTWRFYETDWDHDGDWFATAHRSFILTGGYLEGDLIGGDHTLEALARLRDQGHTIVLITARPDTVALGQDTRYWLTRQGIRYHELHFAADKRDIHIDYMLDDNLDNYDQLTAAGVRCYLRDQPWNQVEAPFRRRVNSVAAYVDAILTHEQEQHPVTEQLATATGLILEESARLGAEAVHQFNLVGPSAAWPEDKDPWAAERDDLLARFAHELGKATGDGSKKRQAGEKPPWYLDDSHEGAILSHLTKWKRGEKVDPDSGAHPLVHAAWRCLAIACRESGNTPDPMIKEVRS